MDEKRKIILRPGFITWTKRKMFFRPYRPIYFLLLPGLTKNDYRPIESPAFFDMVHLLSLTVQIFHDFCPIRPIF